jgi:hypothetical protein
LASVAAASGPAAPGKDILTISCSGLGDVAVSVQGADSAGAAQIVGARGHLVPVTAAFTIVDLTTGEVLEIDADALGGGHAHPSQATTTCSTVLFTDTAGNLAGNEPLPPGVSATDVIQGSISATVVVGP